MNKAGEQLINEIALSLLPNIGSINGKKLIAHFGGAEAVFKQKKTTLQKINGIGSKTLQSILSKETLKRAEKELKFIEKNKISVKFFLDNDFPYRLKHAEDGPIIVYYKGKEVLNHSRILAVVGTRNISERGKHITDAFIANLRDTGVLVVSGLAYGVDTRAHKACVKNGLPTVGVVAHGLDRIYPGINHNLALEMQEQGGILSEFISGTKPDAFNFPRRNRIIAGLADAVLIVESGKKGGSLITAEIAGSYNRDVYAIPGRPDDIYSRGCNFLIKTSRAALVESAADLLYYQRWDLKKKPKTTQTKLFHNLNAKEQIIMDILYKNKKSAIDVLMTETKLPNSKLAATLLNLEFEGLIRCLPGKVYEISQ